MDKIEKTLEFIAGQIEAQRTAFIALILSQPIQPKFLHLYKELQDSQRELLLATTHTDAFLDGMRSEREAIQVMISKGLS